MVGESAGWRAALASRQLTPGPISSLPAMDGLPPFISFSTSYPDLNSAVLRHTDNERFAGYSFLIRLWSRSSSVQSRCQPRKSLLTSELKVISLYGQACLQKVSWVA